MTNKPFDADEKLLLGEGYKKLKKSCQMPTDIESYTSKRKDPEPRRYHYWIEDEMKELSEDCGASFAGFKFTPANTEVDKLGLDIVEGVQERTKSLRAYECLLKYEMAMTALSTFSYNNRDENTVIPMGLVTDDKKTRIYGFIIKGKTHMKYDSDRIPVIVVEFFKAQKDYLGAKYPKHNFMNVKGHLVSIRIHATWPLKTHFMSTIRRTLIPLANTLNRVWFADQAEAGGPLPLNYERLVQVGEEVITMTTWMKRILSLHLWMAVCNDSQLEAVCADSRRLMVFTQALIRHGGSLFINEGGVPEETVAESAVNNPVALYLV
jgi:hypothetical protein